VANKDGEKWQIVNGESVPLKTTMVEAGRKEVDDLKQWILSYPGILGSDNGISGPDAMISLLS
jgi:hypothetical protein